MHTTLRGVVDVAITQETERVSTQKCKEIASRSTGWVDEMRRGKRPFHQHGQGGHHQGEPRARGWTDQDFMATVGVVGSTDTCIRTALSDRRTRRAGRRSRIGHWPASGLLRLAGTSDAERWALGILATASEGAATPAAAEISVPLVEIEIASAIVPASTVPAITAAPYLAPAHVPRQERQMQSLYEIRQEFDPRVLPPAQPEPQTPTPGRIYAVVPRNHGASGAVLEGSLHDTW